MTVGANVSGSITITKTITSLTVSGAVAQSGNISAQTITLLAVTGDGQ